MTVEDFGARWRAAQAKGAVIAQMMAHFGWSKQTCYRKLAEKGYRSGKKRRCDAGESSMRKEDLTLLAAMLREGLRDTGKEQLKIPEARSIMAMNGFAIPVSNRQLARLLQALQLDMRSLKRPAPHSHLRSLHPNHVWQIDPSYCTMYYLRSGKQVILEDKEIYKNKHYMYERLAKKNLKIWRYVCVDHYSGCIFAHYFNAPGENQQNLFEFFLQAAQKKPDNPFCGVPQLLLLDKGSANTSKAMLAALSSLGVKVLTHAAGNSRAKGAVEKGNDIVETTFEIRLRYEPLHSIAELNTAAAAYFVAYNANAVPQRDSRLKRPGGTFVRERLWLGIRESQLRLLPDLALCHRLLAQPAVERTVSEGLSIDFARHVFAGEGGVYSLAPLRREIGVGQKVQVQALAYDGAAILVRYKDLEGKEQARRIAAPLPVDEAGRIATGAVIGEEYKSVGYDRAERSRQDLEQLAHPKELGGKKKNARPFGHLNAGGGLQSHNQIVAAVKKYRQKHLTFPVRGNQIGLGAAQIYQRDYSLPEALAWLKAKLEAAGHVYDKGYVALVRRDLKAGRIAEGQLQQLYQQLTEPEYPMYQMEA